MLIAWCIIPSIHSKKIKESNVVSALGSYNFTQFSINDKRP
jgi:hypothetical protein